MSQDKVWTKQCALTQPCAHNRLTIHGRHSQWQQQWHRNSKTHPVKQKQLHSIGNLKEQKQNHLQLFWSSKQQTALTVYFHKIWEFFKNGNKLQWPISNPSYWHCTASIYTPSLLVTCFCFFQGRLLFTNRKRKKEVKPNVMLSTAQARWRRNPFHWFFTTWEFLPPSQLSKLT